MAETSSLGRGPSGWADVLASPEYRKNFIVQRPLGTLANSIGVEAAEAFFNEPDPFDGAIEPPRIRVHYLIAVDMSSDGI